MMIDMQKDFLFEGGYGYLQSGATPEFNKVREIIPMCQKVLESARNLGLTIVHTREGHEPDLRDLPAAKLLRQAQASPDNYRYLIGDKGPMGRLLVRGQEGHDIIDDLYPRKGEIVIDKPGKGTFYNTDIHQVLVSRGITHILMCGVTTECCVNTTFREANDHGFNCCVLVDCTGGFNDAIVTETINTFCAYDGLLGSIGHGSDLVHLAELHESNCLAPPLFTDLKFASCGFDKGTLVQSMSEIYKYLGNVSEIDEALKKVDFVLVASNREVNTSHYTLRTSPGMMSLDGSNSTIFGSVAIVAKDLDLIHQIFAEFRGYDAKDALSKKGIEFPMIPVDYRGIEHHFTYGLMGPEFPGTKVDFDFKVLSAIKEFHLLIDRPLFDMYFDLVKFRNQVTQKLQPLDAPDVLIVLDERIPLLLGFPYIKLPEYVVITLPGNDGVLLDIVSKNFT